jgi:hypothetical protein
MAVPTKFEGADRGLVAPKGRDDVQILPTQLVVDSNGSPACYSCWELDDEETLEVFHTRKVWIMIEGRTHAPIIVSGKDIREVVEDGD